MHLIDAFRKAIALVRVRMTKTVNPDDTETLIWLREDSGADHVGESINLDGRSGTVISGTMLTVTVRWEPQ